MVNNGNNPVQNCAQNFIYNSDDKDLIFSDVTDIFAKSSDPEELRYAWLEWHRAAGGPSKQSFQEYVAMDNEAAKLNGNQASS